MTALQVLNLIFLVINCIMLAFASKAKKALSREGFLVFLDGMLASGIIGAALAIGVVIELATSGNGCANG